MKDKTKFVKTSEDWYPSFSPLCKPINPDFHNPLNHTAIKVELLHISDGNRRVYVCGCDDFALYLDTKDFDLAEKIYNEIQDFTTKQNLISLGFQPY